LVLSLSLIQPRLELEDSYIGLVQEFLANDEPLIPFPLAFAYDDFPAMLKKLADQSKGIDLPEGFIANSTFWLLNQEQEVVGVSNLRHALTPKLEHEGGHIGYGIRPSQRGKGYGHTILEKTLNKAWELGLDKVLLSCTKQNLASNKVIIKNGGNFDSDAYSEQHKQPINRYWIRAEPERAD
jgi:predicted acetyltransferase